MPMVTEDFIEMFRVMFERSFDVMSDVRNNYTIELFGCYVGIFAFHDVIQFFK
jgi:hypothetical protein